MPVNVQKLVFADAWSRLSRYEYRPNSKIFRCQFKEGSLAQFQLDKSAVRNRLSVPLFARRKCSTKAVLNDIDVEQLTPFVFFNKEKYRASRMAARSLDLPRTIQLRPRRVD